MNKLLIDVSLIDDLCCFDFLNKGLSFFLELIVDSSLLNPVNSLKSASAIFCPPCSFVFAPGFLVKLILNRVWPDDVVVFAAVRVVVEQFDDDDADKSLGFVDVIEPNVPAVNETDWIFAERSATERGRNMSAGIDFLGIWIVVVVVAVVEVIVGGFSFRRWDDFDDFVFEDEDFFVVEDVSFDFESKNRWMITIFKYFDGENPIYYF